MSETFNRTLRRLPILTSLFSVKSVAVLPVRHQLKSPVAGEAFSERPIPLLLLFGLSRRADSGGAFLGICGRL